MNDPPPSRSAFTLLELVVVMVILAVAAMVIAPSLGGFASARETEFAAGQIVTLAHWARTQAISEGQTYRLNFDANAQPQRYWLTLRESGVDQRFEKEFGRDFTFPEGVSAQWDGASEGGVSYMDFDPSGRTVPTQIRITGKNGQIIDVACLSATELLKIVDDSPQGVR